MWVEEPALEEWVDLRLGAGIPFETGSLGGELAQERDFDPDLLDSDGSYEASESTTEAWHRVEVPPPPDALEDLGSLAL